MAWLHNKVFRAIILMVVLVATIYFFYLIWEVVLSFLVAGVLAYFLYRPVLWVENRGLSRSGAIFLIYLLLVIVLTGVFWFSIPRLIHELSSAATLLPQYAEQFEQLPQRIDGMQLPEKLEQIITENTLQVENAIYVTLQNVILVMFNILSKIFMVIFAPIMAFYIIKDWELIKTSIAMLLPPITRKELRVVALNVDAVILEFTKGYLMVAVIIGVLVGTTAALLRIKYALLIGIIAGLGELIPYFGPFLGGIPAVGLALSQSPTTALYMALAIVIIQPIEANIITPRLIGEKVGMHPLLMVLALLAGGKLMGFWGLLIAVPLAASLKIIGQYLYLKIIES